jgi:Ca-activated chloride channel family protein
MGAIQLSAQQYLRQLLVANPRQLVGLVGFSNTATLHHSLTPVGPSSRSLCHALQSLYPQGGTNLSAGLVLAMDQLVRVDAVRKSMVLITDGAANVSTSCLHELLRRARSSGIRIFTIGVGNNSNRDYDRPLLVTIARSTGGRFNSAHSFEALCNALRKAG